MTPLPLCFAMLLAISAWSSTSQAQGDRKPVILPEPKIQYLGVGGWLLHWQGEGVLIAPSFSNPSLLDWPPLHVAANKSRIDQFMPPADDVSMLLVGHGHYDHLLDVPWIMATKTPHATLYGSMTVKNIMHAFSDREKMTAKGLPWVDFNRVVDASIDMVKIPGCEDSTVQADGKWINSKGGFIRVMPIQSMHASHFLGYTVASGESPQLDNVPTTVFGWKQGQSMAWLIELWDKKYGYMLNQNGPAYRIHFQDSAATPPCGLPPATIDGKKTAVDVEILGVSGWDNVTHYPDELLKRSTPRLILLGHWESFFGNDLKKKPKPLLLQDLEGMRQAINTILKVNNISAEVRLPAPLDDVALPARLR